MNKAQELMTRIYVAMKSKEKGQGVIEYAGALIIAALIVVAVLAIGSSGMGNVYNSLFAAVENFFNNEIGNL